MQTDTRDVLGMRLSEALAWAQARGVTPILTETAAPPSRNDTNPRLGGCERVIRVQGERWTFSRFQDQVCPEGKG